MRIVQVSYNMTRMWLTVFDQEHKEGELPFLRLPNPDSNSEEEFATILVPVWQSNVSFGVN